jgi:ribokinase
VPGRPRVCVVGSLHFDIMVRAPYLPRTGETLIGEAWWWKQGGKGGNQAVAAARHGARVEMVGCLGDDAFGARLRERLEAAGVDLAHVRTVVRGSGMSVAIVQEGGDYAAIVVSGANREIDEAWIARSAPAIGGARVLVLQDEVAETANAAAARLARAADVRVVLNAAPARPLGSLAGLVDVLVVNTVEAEMLGAGRVDGLESAAAAARALRAQAPTVVVTAGAAGLAAAADTETVTVPAHQVPRAETHGAGDAFVGAFAACLADGAPLADALRYANAAAALHVGTPEADHDALGPADVRRLLDRPRAPQGPERRALA